MSGIVGTIAIVSFYKNYKKRLKVRNLVIRDFSPNEGGKIISLKFTVTNTGIRPIVLTKAYFIIRSKSNIKHYLRPDISHHINSDIYGNFPITLNEGQLVTFSIDYSDYDFELERIGSDQLQFSVIDSTCEIFNTKWLSVKFNSIIAA
jgi:hypothetical protein